MKTKLHALVFTLGLFLLSVTGAKAQTSVTLQAASDSTWGSNCPIPVNISFWAYGDAIGYNPATDSITMQVFWGDGNDTTFKVPIWNTSFYAWASHVYTTTGIFSVQYIATGPDGMADTISSLNEFAVSNVCGNVNGKVYNDLNGDCQYTSADSVLRSVPVVCKVGSSIVQWSYTDINGNYYFSVPNGNYTVELNNTNWYGYVPACPSSGSFAVNTSSNPTNNFGMTCTPGFDLQADCSGWGFRPGFNAVVNPVAMNATCMPVSGTITLTLDPLTTFVNSLVTPASVNGQVITWNFSNISNQNYWYLWNGFWDQVTVYTSLSANIGDTVCFTVTVTPSTGDIDLSNNTMTFCIDVRNSWDPNDKHVTPQGIGAAGNVAPNTDFDYTIHFQNTGTDVAYNIAIIDTIDSDLDMTTFQVTGSSHTMSPEIFSGNIVKFNFNNILLVDSGTSMPGSQGWVTYRVKTKPNLQHGTQIHNTAYIYFDFNPAIITNTTLNTIDIALGVNEVVDALSFGLFPNPVSDQVTISFSERFTGEVSLADVLGNVVMKEKADGSSVTMSVQTLTPGVYTILLNGEGVSAGKKMIVIH